MMHVALTPHHTTTVYMLASEPELVAIALQSSCAALYVTNHDCTVEQIPRELCMHGH